jgi:hypothetical protein
LRRYLFFASQVYALAILRPLARAIRERGDEGAWFTHDRVARHLRADETRLDDVAAVKSYAPLAVFVPGNWVPDFFPGIKVELFHGFNASKRSERKGHFRIRGYFDLYCTQGPRTTKPFEDLARRHGYFRVAETGWPKLDPLFDPAATGDSGGERPVVLYTSTFNDSLSSTRALFETIRECAANGPWDWLVTFHPKMPVEIVARYKGIQGAHLRFCETDDVVPLLRRADVMLSDTSSILHEFLVLNKPVVTFRTRAPANYLIDVAEPADVVAGLTRALDRPSALMAAIEQHAHEIHPFRDGCSSRRVLEATDRFLAVGRTGLRRKPLNLWRRLQARRRLAYYRLT